LTTFPIIFVKKKSINIVYNVNKEEEIIISISENDTNDQFY